jgi:hypothetical protein
MYPNVEGLVWAAAGSCSSPQNAKAFAASGLHQVSFSLEEVHGKDTICFASNDGMLHTSAQLRQ